MSIYVVGLNQLFDAEIDKVCVQVTEIINLDDLLWTFIGFFMVLLLQFYGFEANAVLLASFFTALMFSGKQTLTPTCFWQFLNGNWCRNRFGMFIDSK